MRMEKVKGIVLFFFLLKGVWCREFSISLPEKIEALSGSCVLIECAFEIPEQYDKDLTESAAGLWYKDNHINPNNPVFNSRNTSEKHFRGKLTGKIEEKNCTTIFYDVSSNHDGTYYFRIEGNGGLKYTYIKPDVTINVIDSPHNPTVKLYVDEKEVQSQQEVLEGSSVCLSCSTETLCSSPPATLTWSSTSRLPPFSLQEKQNQNKLISHLNFTATPLQHTVTFTCTVTYQLQDNNKTAHSNLTLHVTYAPKISLSSSCNRTDVTVCLCEVDGNPSPKLEWHLSGRPVTNSTIMSISEERLSSTVLRSFITLHHSLTNTSTVQCVTTNTHGKDTQLLIYTQESTDANLLTVLVGAGVGVAVMMIFCVLKHLCTRESSRSSQMRQEDTTGPSLANRAVSKDEEEFVYANKDMQSPGGATSLNYPESLHYSSIDVTNTKPESKKFRGISSLNTEYAVVRHYSGGLSKAENSVKDDDYQHNSNISTAFMVSQIDQTKPDRKAKIREVSSQPSEDTYENITNYKIVPREPCLLMSADVVTKEVLSKGSNPKLLTQLGEISDLYAQVKRNCCPDS